MPTLRASGGTEALVPALAIVWPPMRISPSSGASKPATSCSVVVLPQPEGPTSASVSPRRTASVSPSTAGPVPPGNRLVTPSRTRRSIRSGNGRQRRLAVEDGEAVAHGEVGHLDARLGGRAGDVWSQRHVRQRQQAGMDLRLLLEDVQAGAGDPALR